MASRSPSLLLRQAGPAAACSAAASSAHASTSSAFLLPRRRLSPSACSSSSPSPLLRRSFALSPARRAESDDAPAEEDEYTGPPTWHRIRNERLLAWFKGEGERFKWPKERAHNWIGGDRPYTANPYFNPTPPLSADLQDEMYAVYVSFPAAVTAVERVNLISERYNIGKDRVTAAVKTGQVADSWKEAGLAPQNAFVRGMEDVLVVPRHKTGNSDALAAFPSYLGSRIDLERDVETARLARGEITARIEDDGFGNGDQSRRIGFLSWELAAEGETPLSVKMQLEKPLRPPRAVPAFPSTVITQSRSQAVVNVVDVGDKFRGQGWDGRIGHEAGRNATAPGKQNALGKFVPVLKRAARAARVAAGEDVEPTTEERRAARLAAKRELNARGELTPTQQIIAKRCPGGVYDSMYLHKAARNQLVHLGKVFRREKNARSKSAAHRVDLANAKVEFQQMVRDRINGKI